MFGDTSTAGWLVLCQASLSCANFLSRKEENCWEEITWQFQSWGWVFFFSSYPHTSCAAALVFVVLINYLACSTFPFPKAKRWTCQKFQWDLPTAFLSSKTSVRTSDVQVRLLGRGLWELKVVWSNFPFCLTGIQSRNCGVWEKAKDSGFIEAFHLLTHTWALTLGHCFAISQVREQLKAMKSSCRLANFYRQDHHLSASPFVKQSTCFLIGIGVRQLLRSISILIY